MISEQMDYLFEINGYTKVPSNLPEFTFYYRRENQGTVVVHVIDYRQGIYISEDQYVHLKQRIREFINAKGEQEVHLLSLILSSDTEKAKRLCVSDSFCWMIDTGSNRLIIHENQVGDFYGWKGIIEEFLLHPDAAAGSGGQEAYGSGGQGTYGSSGQEAYGSGGQGTYGSSGQEAYGNGGQGTYRSSGQGTYGSSDQRVYGGKGQGVYGGGGQGASGSGSQGTYGSNGQGVYGGGGQGAYGSSSQRVYGSGSQGAYEGGSQGTYGGGGQGTYGNGSQGAYGGSGKRTYGSGAYAPQESVLGKGRDKTWMKNLPWVNICLIIVNAVVFLICTFTGGLLYNKGALGVMLIMDDQSYYRIITSMFLHADTGHLFSNMIVLYYAGEIVEKRLGHILYAVLYFLSGIAGGILSMGYELMSGNYINSVGASGAVFGVEGALLLLVILHHGKLESVTLGRLAFVIAFSLYCGFTSSDVNNAAHIGGVLMGFALAAVFQMLRPCIRTGKDRDFDEN